jgi:transposase-like protein
MKSMCNKRRSELTEAVARPTGAVQGHCQVERRLVWRSRRGQVSTPNESRRDQKAAKRLFRKLLKKQGRAPRVLITDKLRSCCPARDRAGVEHRQHKGLNNRAENSTTRPGDES